MKFKFCSDGDCPQWALAALHALSSLPAQLFKRLLTHVVEESTDDGVIEILKDTNLHSRDECARAVAVVRWVLHQSWRGGCAGAQLTRDLLVLGVPRAHATALAEVVDSNREPYVANEASNGFMINKVTDVAVSPAPDGAGDMVKLTLFTEDVFIGEQKKEDLLIDKSQIKTLLAELKKAYAKMEELDGKNVDQKFSIREAQFYGSYINSRLRTTEKVVHF